MTELPSGWAVANIGSLCDLVNGMAFKPTDWTNEGLKIVRIQNLNNPDAPYNRYNGELRNRFIIDHGDLLFAWSGTPGTSFGAHIWRGDRAVLNQHIFRVDFDQTALSKSFFRLAINQKLSQLIGKAHGGAGLQHVTKGRFEETLIEVPPLPEQHRIVARIEELFSELDASVESLTKARALLGLYRQSLLKAAFQGKLTADWRAANPDKLEPPETLLFRIRQERDKWYQHELEIWRERCSVWEQTGMLGPRPSGPDSYVASSPLQPDDLAKLPELPDGWVYTRLNELAAVGSGMSVSKGRELADPIEVAYLRVANVQRGHLDLDVLKTMPVEKSQVPSLALRVNDILFNEGGDRDKLGRGWVWEGAVDPCITQNHVFRATLFSSSEATAKLVSHWGNSNGQDYFEKGGKQTTNLASINKSVLKALPVPVIPQDEAEELFARLESALSVVDTTEVEITTSLIRIAALRQSILKRAFSGRLVAQDPSDEPASALLARLQSQTPTTPARRKRRA